ncbi:hypothetical protein tloyanaT_13410 [Thalassotalea loyana]|uniref:HTH cro/C1-type domain-containing protein n=1 Tax=Thalassotalea loyana TaxID=280483 RepID=A0ABQ6HC19_9GAMM|nr:helix-turn-helix domain-containing protein [Thalassotalea loyana]GLX85089.1 hypothetical protein tloyanaT_13410 [Thalassotalea loyana]
MKFEDKLKSRMKELGIKQVDLVRKTGKSKTSVSRWMRGSIPRGKALIDLAEMLSVSTEWLVGDTEINRSIEWKWKGSEELDHQAKIPAANILPIAFVNKDTLSWEMTGDVTLSASSNSASILQDDNDYIVLDSDFMQQLGISPGRGDLYCIVRTSIASHISQVDINPMVGGFYIGAWRENPVLMHLSLTADDGIRIKKMVNSRSEEVVAKDAISNISGISILGQVESVTTNSTEMFERLFA